MIVRINERQSSLDALLALLNGGGSLKGYSGTRPAAFTLLGNVLLCTCLLSATAFGATNSSGVATANAVTPDTAPAASGTLSFMLACKSDGTPFLNLSVGLVGSGADVIVDTLVTTAGSGTVSVSAATINFPAGS